MLILMPNIQYEDNLAMKFLFSAESVRRRNCLRYFLNNFTTIGNMAGATHSNPVPPILKCME